MKTAIKFFVSSFLLLLSGNCMAAQSRDIHAIAEEVRGCQKFLDSVVTEYLTFSSCRLDFRFPAHQVHLKRENVNWALIRRGNAITYPITGAMSGQIEVLSLAAGHAEFPKDYLKCNIDGEATMKSRSYYPNSESNLIFIDLRISSDKKSVFLKTINKQGDEFSVECK